ncbi:alpha/beta hydrolase [Curvibacter sp. CHRR-16]|uniref:esterase/lipase family protein n=1 Tax=Curvibacter sp. CHRR-16 TaxID=2835872 RepID=UPI001BDB2701|nr:alpha/beta hydrolase [Curvibacter sp. CHRR-16]MBT0571426.1 alpha/beta hydrolase [Curvibacter sp. CHRR-16]
MNISVITNQRHAAKVGARLLTYVSLSSKEYFRPATGQDFVDGKVALFIHGFTANADYMVPIMEEFALAGYTSIAYNYPCYDGIDSAAQALQGLLAIFNTNTQGALEKNKIVVIGHSMGGLVTRALVAMCSGHNFVRKALTIGSPHDGTLVKKALLGLMVAAGERISGVVHGGYGYAAKSALQLTKQDTTSGTPFLDVLNSTRPSGQVEFHSFSGGLPELRIGTNWLVNQTVNWMIQRYFKGAENDGLVGEASSNLAGLSVSGKNGTEQHHKNYTEFPKINHTHLCQNQTLNQLVLSKC